jgi:hypothetical protein
MKAMSYKMHDENTNECLTTEKGLLTKEECEEVLMDIKENDPYLVYYLQQDVGTQNHPSYPKGCYLHMEENYAQIKYNGHATGEKNPYSYPLCSRKQTRKHK